MAGIQYRSARAVSMEDDQFKLETPDGDLVCTTTHACAYLNARFSVGTVEGDPDGDDVFLVIEKDGTSGEEGESTIRLMRLDEMAVLASLCSAAVAAVLCGRLSNVGNSPATS